MSRGAEKTSWEAPNCVWRAPERSWRAPKIAPGACKRGWEARDLSWGPPRFGLGSIQIELRSTKIDSEAPELHCGRHQPRQCATELRRLPRKPRCYPRELPESDFKVAPRPRGELSWLPLACSAFRSRSPRAGRGSLDAVDFHQGYTGGVALAAHDDGVVTGWERGGQG